MCLRRLRHELSTTSPRTPGQAGACSLTGEAERSYMPGLIANRRQPSATVREPFAGGPRLECAEREVIVALPSGVHSRAGGMR